MAEPRALRPFRARLRALRAARGWSFRELAERSGVPHPTLVHYSTGRIVLPAADHVMRLADAFEVTVDYLLGRSE